MKKYKIGYTNGVFDLLHVGHLEFLKKAKSYCDYLIVAVCEDQLAYANKGKLPIFSVEERMTLLESIKYIDKVVIQTTTDRVLEWNKYYFNVIFHGIDGKEWDIEHGYFDALSRLGVESVYFQRSTNISTSQIINKILEEYRK
ncbi:MAG: adenylyltransferase/cytidyltransferase family protein [Ruminococcus sp.]|jgi:glycerol-3-phosphate cytidylyltransferase|uniref:adenylyltransferase/cytidyltransferase family protein n=1 Tax=Ruminococcus sp. TaxID=41978 RepID=UPI00399A95A4